MGICESRDDLTRELVEVRPERAALEQTAPALDGLGPYRRGVGRTHRLLGQVDVAGPLDPIAACLGCRGTRAPRQIAVNWPEGHARMRVWVFDLHRLIAPGRSQEAYSLRR
jgi:hypothetical protein